MNSPDEAGKSVTVGATVALPPPGYQLVEEGGTSIRVGPWSNAPGIGQLVVLPGSRGLHGPAVDKAVATARSLGFGRLRTGALGPDDAKVFEARGFALETNLVLLRKDLRDPIERRERRLRRMRSDDWPAIAALDAASFPRYWHFDEAALREACAATPASRVRILGRVPLGYVIAGRSAGTGFVQRLAVHPTQAGRGIGRALVIDALHWLRRRGGVHAFVNTQDDNARAIDLYERLGFTIEPRPLMILGRTIEP